jgi:hypothetical protein
MRKISDFELEVIVASWWRNEEYEKLKWLKYFNDHEAAINCRRITNADKLEQIENIIRDRRERKLAKG